MDPSISGGMTTRRPMRFVLVNGRTPCKHSLCVLCCEPIGMSYLREIGTRLPYCGPGCYANHCKNAVPTPAPEAYQLTKPLF
jgi:hypothetical protein